MLFSFDKSDMYTGSAFVLDSFEAQQALFVDVTSEEDFGADFLKGYKEALLAVGGTPGGLGRGAVSQATNRLYTEMDAVKPRLDKLEIRLDLVNAKDLTVPVKDFRLSKLRDRIDVRDAEGAVTLLQKLNKVVADNVGVLAPRGHKQEDTDGLKMAETEIARLNREQNSDQNDAITNTGDGNKLFKELDKYVKKVMKAGRKIFKKQRDLRRQFEKKAVVGRMNAGEKPKPRGGDGEVQG